MITTKDLKPSFDHLIKCGLAEKTAHQEISFALEQINSDAKIRGAQSHLILNAVKMVGNMGLSLNPNKQEAVLVNYMKGKGSGCFFQPMYRGLLKTAIKEGAIVAANCKVIHQGDFWKFHAGRFKDMVDHQINDESAIKKTRVPLITYCLLLLPNGTESLTLLYEDEYQVIKGMGSAAIHKLWGDQMRMKSALKRGLKLAAAGEHTPDLDQMIQYDNLHYDLNDPNINPKAEPKPEPASSKETKVSEKLNPKNLPVLTETHKFFAGCVKGLFEKTHTLESLRKNIYISEDMESILELAVQNYIPSPEKLPQNAK